MMVCTLWRELVGAQCKVFEFGVAPASGEGHGEGNGV